MTSSVPPQSREGSIDWEFVVLVALNVTFYLASNYMSVRIVDLGIFGAIDAGTITFPLVFMLSNVTTEIWGLKLTEKIIWLTFACNILMSMATMLVVALPAPEFQQAVIVPAYRTVFLSVPRIIIASLTAFLAGGFTNAILMAKIKEATKGRWLWMRTIGSSFVGYIVDSIIFTTIAFANTAPWKTIGEIIAIQFITKMCMEILFSTPLDYGLVAFLRRRHDAQGRIPPTQKK